MFLWLQNWSTWWKSQAPPSLPGRVPRHLLSRLNWWWSRGSVGSFWSTRRKQGIISSTSSFLRFPFLPFLPNLLLFANLVSTYNNFHWCISNHNPTLLPSLTRAATSSTCLLATVLPSWSGSVYLGVYLEVVFSSNKIWTLFVLTNKIWNNLMTLSRTSQPCCNPGHGSYEEAPVGPVASKHSVYWNKNHQKVNLSLNVF